MSTDEPRRSALRRIAYAVVAAEVERLRDARLPLTGDDDWADDTLIGDDGLGLDSLERLGALGALAETFDLDDSRLGQDSPHRVGDWLDWVLQAQASGDGRITVRTSGSTGAQRPCGHATADLLDEARWLAARFGDRRRVVALVPAHHLYGMIWTALLPSVLDVPVVVRRIGSPLGLAAGDLVVAVPDQWQAMLRLTRRFPADVVGVTSAGPLPETLGADLLAAGLTRLVDVYGSSETGAIALRDVPATSYALLPRWRMVPDGDDWHLLDRDGTAMPLPDHVVRLGDRALRPTGRRDGAVQVGGHNVWPERVARVLCEADGVAEAVVRLHADGRLKAFIVPAASCDPVALPERLHLFAADRLADHERPKMFRFGAALPRTAMGKMQDWA